MSRKVEADRALSDDDRRYLRGLGAHGAALESRIDAEYPPDAEALADFEKQERKASAELNGVGLTAGDQSALMAENERLRAELEALRAGQEPSEEDGEPVDYSSWLKADLEAEVDRVNKQDPNAGLEKGKVDDMKAALTAYFTE